MSGKPSKHDKWPIRLAHGTSASLGKCKNAVISWGALGRILSEPVRTGEKFRAYKAMSQDERNRLKNVNGWYLGGPVDGGQRRKDAIKQRHVLTLDLDDCPPELWEAIKDGVTPISGYEFHAHTTRSHAEDAPRVRMIFGFKEPVDADKYDAVARIFGVKLDPTLDAIDDVSFRVAQLMYNPTCSKDGAFEYIHNRGDLIDAEALLASWPGWEDYTKLPYSEKQGQKRPAAKKAENPHEKPGIIGAFCRAHDVESAMAFIPDVYSAGDDHSNKPRYTYNAGSGANGVVVEDGGLFIYSHHGTDPCGDRLVNAWDMVRIHRFGHLDEGVSEDTSPSKMPSYKAMVELARSDQAVREELMADKYDLVAMFDDVADDDGYKAGEQPEDDEDDLSENLGDSTDPTTGRKKPKPPKKGWQMELELSQKGEIISGLYNAATILGSDPRLWGVIARNEFTGKIVARRPLKSKLRIVPPVEVEDRDNGKPWQELNDISIRAILEAPAGKGKQGYGLKVTDRDLNGAVILAAEHHRFHPVKEYWGQLKWDGKERVERIFIDYLGCPDEPYYRETIKLFLIAAVARIYTPGHKFDFAPILSGPQGIRKSTFIKALFGAKWTGELSANFDDEKTLVEQMLGKLCSELPELSAMRKSENEQTKQWMSKTEDEVRLAYERRVTIFPRQCVFMGTTNAKTYLKDRTGNRRWWPIAVNVSTIDTDKLAAERGQIWAEALVRYRELCRKYNPRHLPLYLNDVADATAKELQEEHREESQEEGIAGMLADWADTPQPLSVFLGKADNPGFVDDDEPWVVPVYLCTKQCYIEALGGEPKQYAGNATLAQKIGNAIRLMTGWRTAGRKTIPRYGYQRIHVRIDAAPEEKGRGYRIVDGPAQADNLDLL